MSQQLPSRVLETAQPLSSEPGTVLLETERLILRRWKRGDEPHIPNVANYREIFRNLRDRFPSPYTPEEAEIFISRRCDPANWTEYPTHVAIFVKPNTAGNQSAEPMLIGGMGTAAGGDVEYRSWELGYWFAPWAWGNGYATEMVKAFVPWVFATWPKLNRLFATIYHTNPASIRVLEKARFVNEGIIRGCFEKEGVLVDAVMLSVIRSDLEKN